MGSPVITKDAACLLVRLGLLDPTTAGEWDHAGRPPDVDYPEENLVTLAGEVFHDSEVVYDEARNTPHFMRIEVVWSHASFQGHLVFEVSPLDAKARTVLTVTRWVEGRSRTLVRGALDLRLVEPFAPSLLAVFSRAFGRFEEAIRKEGSDTDQETLVSPFDTETEPPAPRVRYGRPINPIRVPEDAPDPIQDFDGFLDALPSHSPVLRGTRLRPGPGRTEVDDMLEDLAAIDDPAALSEDETDALVEQLLNGDL